MPDIENLLREELKRAAERSSPNCSGRSRFLPDGPVGVRACSRPAAAAVIAVIMAGVFVAGLTPAHKPAAHKPAVSGSAPASLPRFYVTTSSAPDGRGIQAVVRASASGQVTGTVPVPSAIPVEWADSGGTFVTAAADDRSFVIGVQGGQEPTQIGLDLRLFRFAISAAGEPGHLTELAAAPARDETTEGIALSPDGKLLAVSMTRASPADAAPSRSSTWPPGPPGPGPRRAAART